MEHNAPDVELMCFADISHSTPLFRAHFTYGKTEAWGGPWCPEPHCQAGIDVGLTQMTSTPEPKFLATTQMTSPLTFVRKRTWFCLYPIQATAKWTRVPILAPALRLPRPGGFAPPSLNSADSIITWESGTYQSDCSRDSKWCVYKSS